MKVKITKSPPPNGLEVNTSQYKTLSSDGVNLLGPSHAKGGIDVSSNGQVVEAEGGEPLYSGTNGENYVFGNMTNPSTGKLFKNEGKTLLEDKGKVEKSLEKANDVVSENDPYSKAGSLTYNAGVVQLDANKLKEQDLKAKLDTLAKIQDSILSTAQSIGVDPNDFSKKLNKNKGNIKVRIKGSPTSTAKDGKTFSDYFLPPTPEFYPMQAQVPSVSPTTKTQIPPIGTTLSERNNNPGNLRFIGQPGATKGDKGFAKFASYEDGMRALVNDLKAKQSGKSRTGLKPTSTLQELINVYAPAADSNDPTAYARTLSSRMGIPINTPISQIDTQQLAKNMAAVEDSAYAQKMGAPASTSFSPDLQGSPQVSRVSTSNPSAAVEPNAPRQNLQIDPIKRITSPQALPVNINTTATPLTQQQINRGATPQQVQQQYTATPPTPNRLTPLDYLGEVSALFDRPDYVQGQQFNPSLMTPYRVSFQDQINQNTADFNALSKSLADNPEALATLAGQKYQQDQSILANEFRANQGVQNQVANQNNQILNQAQLQNNQYSDTQYQRQAQAQAITEQNRQNALNSISSKYAQNRLYNNSREEQFKQDNILHNMYKNYSFDENGNIQYNNTGSYNWMYPSQGAIPLTPGVAATEAELNKQKAKKVAQAAFGYKFKK